MQKSHRACKGRDSRKEGGREGGREKSDHDMAENDGVDVALRWPLSPLPLGFNYVACQGNGTKSWARDAISAGSLALVLGKRGNFFFTLTRGRNDVTISFGHTACILLVRRARERERPHSFSTRWLPVFGSECMRAGKSRRKHSTEPIGAIPFSTWQDMQCDQLLDGMSSL